MPRLVGSSDTRVAVSQYPGDAITFMLDVASVQATLLKSTETHLVVIVDKPDGSCQQWEIGREESWALGWYNSHQSRITTTVAELMRSSQLAVDDQVRPSRVRLCPVPSSPPSVPQVSTVVFCTLCYPYGQGTAAAFDLAPMDDCPAGSYVPVEVRLYELMGRELLLALYLPVRGLARGCVMQLGRPHPCILPIET